MPFFVSKPYYLAGLEDFGETSISVFGNGKVEREWVKPYWVVSLEGSEITTTYVSGSFGEIYPDEYK